MDELSSRLIACRIGCVSGNMLLNHIMYADDLVVFCPSSGGMQPLLKICSNYGREFDIKYNSTKSNMLVVKSRLDTNLSVPEFLLNDTRLEVGCTVKYLGHYIQDDLKDDKDILRQRSKLYGQGNMLVRKFHIMYGRGQSETAIAIRSFCSSLYTC